MRKNKYLKCKLPAQCVHIHFSQVWALNDTFNTQEELITTLQHVGFNKKHQGVVFYAFLTAGVSFPVQQCYNNLTEFLQQRQSAMC